MQQQSQSVFGQSSALSFKKTNTEFPALLDTAPASNAGFLAANKHWHAVEQAARGLLEFPGFTPLGPCLVEGPEGEMPTGIEGGQGLEGTQRCGSPPDHSHARCVQRASSMFTNNQNYLQPDDLIVPSDLTNLCINKGLFSNTGGKKSSWTGGT